MHRSGTSLTASLFASAGLDLGPELLGANASNPLGHFEDLGFQDFHSRALIAQGVGGEGYSSDARGIVPPLLRVLAHDLVEARATRRKVWGWKDPRTTLFLDFWAERLPQARYLFVFRRPWEVADSLFRRGDEVFAVDPTFVFDVWTHYNRLILDFVRRSPERCALFAIEQIIADPAAVLSDVQTRFDLPLESPVNRYRDSLFNRDEDEQRAALVQTVAPEAWWTYLELLDAAAAHDDLTATRAAVRAGAEAAVVEWAWRSRTKARAPRTTEAPGNAPARHWRGLFTEIAAASRWLFAGHAHHGVEDATETARPQVEARPAGVPARVA